MVVVVDDEDRENEGDLTMAAQFVTPEAVNFMAAHGRGLICLSDHRGAGGRAAACTPWRAATTSRFGTAFTVSIEAREGVTTGISAADRAHTIQVAIDPRSRAGGPGAARARVPPASRGRAACWRAPARPRRRSTWPAWPG